MDCIVTYGACSTSTEVRMKVKVTVTRAMSIK
jgi:hypothetical protein